MYKTTPKKLGTKCILQVEKNGRISPLTHGGPAKGPLGPQGVRL